MGRYYSGDIEGKFWFALQSSTSPSRFGVDYSEPSYITYCYQEEDLQGVVEEIERIEESLGDKKKIIEEYFSKKSSYNDDSLKEIGVDEFELSEYADLGLGIKIRDCIINNGECTFDAEI